MPGGDGTGPFGTWVRCMSVDENLKFRSKPSRKRFWRRRYAICGRGFGWRRGTLLANTQPTEMTKEEELKALKEEAEIIEQEKDLLRVELENIYKRIEELETIEKEGDVE